jgi:signal transduction histidine kinase/DNA-binding response OmpR family regulator
MLSARAGEESRVEGMEAGADDYLVKPFSARELLARVGAHLQMARFRKEANTSLRQSEERLASELAATTRLHALSSRLLSATDLPTALDDVLGNAIATCGADFGNIQLFNRQAGALEIVAQKGFREEFLDHFRTVRVAEGSACAQAMESGERVVLEDVTLDPTFQPHRAVAASAGYRAVVSTPLKTYNGTIVGMLSTHFRTTHRPSERDQRLLDLHARLAADLIERRRYEQALKDADRRKDEFLATLAHELRNPLAPIRNAIQITKMSDQREVREQARALMERQLEQMVRLVDDLMDVSRITRDKLELRRERVELAAVVRNAVETSRPVIEQACHELTVTLPPQPVHLDADPTRLAQVLLNLLNNASKYTDRGGRIWLSAERQGSDAVVSVRDTGIGIPREALGRIFEMFSQVDRTLERSRGGLGIGLTLVKRLVEMHGGRIEAGSDGPGKGSTFTLRLPALIEPPRPGHQGKEKEEVALRSALRILIVDDNLDGADSLSMMLRIMGNDTRTAYDGLEAVAVAAAFRPDVVLLDIGLPKLNGYDTCRRIREQPWGRGMVLIAVTGWGHEEDVRRSHEAGFDRHMVKPVDPCDLMKLLAGLETAKGRVG